jgi:hypothetical protein
MNTTVKHHYLSEGQIKLLTDMVNERFEADDDAGRAPFRAAWYEIDNRDDFQRVLDRLHAIPTLARRQVEATRRDRPTPVREPGYYRNPADGTLYRIVEHTDTPKWGKPKKVLKVAVYSKTGGPRRLDVSGNLVKGRWLDMRKAEGIRLRCEVIQADWKIDEAGLLEFAYGFCPLHGGGLTDGVSVALGYGPTCAKKHGLPWNEAAAREVLIAQGINPDEFLSLLAGPAEG